MSITGITIDELRRMEEQEGLVLQGCGGPLQDWLNGINSMLSQAGILKNGTKLEDIHTFQNEGATCMLFPTSTTRTTTSAVGVLTAQATVL